VDRDEFVKRYTEPFRYKDTGREVSLGSLKDRVKKAYTERGLVDAGLEGLSAVTEPMDSIVGAPYRKLLLSLAEGRGLNSVPDAINQMGKDPVNAPTGPQIAEKVFPDESDVLKRTALSTIADVSDLGSLTPLGAVAKAGKLPFMAKVEAKGAKALLDKYDTLDKVKAIRGKPEYGDYLKALDETHGDQAKRAKDLGFGNKKTYYHGTNADIEAFDPDRLGENTTGITKKIGTHFTSEPEVAATYGNQIMPVKLNTMGGKAYYPEMSSLGPEEAKLAFSNALEGRPTIFRDAIDAIDQQSMKPSDVAIIPALQEHKIRSVNAAFDPRFKDSSDLLAGAVPAFGLNDLLNYKEDEKNKKRPRFEK
jgi:hypothetical protein